MSTTLRRVIVGQLLWTLMKLPTLVLAFGLMFFFKPAPLSTQTYGVDSPVPVTLQSMRDTSRPLLVFALSDADPRFRQQLAIAAHNAYELHQRQVITVPLAVHETSKPLGFVFDGSDLGSMQPAEAAIARKRFRIASGEFTVILLGKDGGEKLRSHIPLSFEKLRDTIDAMPMRRQEMRHPQ